MPEVLNMSNRIYVMSNGRIVRHVIGDNRTEEAVLEGFFGHPLSEVHADTAQESYA
jgi:ABC-type sugar transport system ATPase subunit